MPYYKPMNSRVKEAREDVDLLKMAMAQMWPVDADQREQLIQRQMDIVTDPALPAEVKSGAAKNVLAAGLANLKALDTIIRLGLAQASVRQQGRISSDEEIAEGLKNFMEPKVEAEVPAIAEPQVDGWRLQA